MNRKIEQVRDLLKKKELKALRLKGVDWFAWITGGGDSHVIFGNEAGIAEVLIDANRALVLTSPIEENRLRLEQVPREFEILSFPWADPTAQDAFVAREFKAGQVMSDRPVDGERTVDADFVMLKLVLGEREISRYRELGRDAANAVHEALEQVVPEMTEWDVAGLASKALWSRGIQPLLTIAAGEGRVTRHRHPVSTNTKMGQHAMLVVCGRRHGLYANLTRHVYFRTPTAEENDLARGVAAVEAAAFRATEAMLPLTEIYQKLKEAYASLGRAHEIELHHQGGSTGYLSREIIARATGPAELDIVKAQMAFAWNPSLPGAKIEDTVVLGADHRLEVLTCGSDWPSFDFDGLRRPDLWVR